MAYQLSVLCRNAMLDAIEVFAGTTPVLKIRTGAQPANCAAADSGSVVSTITLPSDWMAAADAGAKAMSGTWADASADATGVAAHFRLYKADGTTCVMQGSCGESDAQMILDNTDLNEGQAFSITSFTLTAGNA